MTQISQFQRSFLDQSQLGENLAELVEDAGGQTMIAASALSHWTDEILDKFFEGAAAPTEEDLSIFLDLPAIVDRKTDERVEKLQDFLVKNRAVTQEEEVPPAGEEPSGDKLPESPPPEQMPAKEAGGMAEEGPEGPIRYSYADIRVSVDGKTVVETDESGKQTVYEWTVDTLKINKQVYALIGQPGGGGLPSQRKNIGAQMKKALLARRGDRNRFQFSWKHVAEDLSLPDLTQQRLMQMASGQGQIKMGEMLNLAKYFDVPLKWFFSTDRYPRVDVEPPNLQSPVHVDAAPASVEENVESAAPPEEHEDASGPVVAQQGQEAASTQPPQAPATAVPSEIVVPSADHARQAEDVLLTLLREKSLSPQVMAALAEAQLTGQQVDSVDLLRREVDDPRLRQVARELRALLPKLSAGDWLMKVKIGSLIEMFGGDAE